MHQDRPSSVPKATGEEVLCVLLGVKLCLLHRCSGKMCQVDSQNPAAGLPELARWHAWPLPGRRAQEGMCSAPAELSRTLLPPQSRHKPIHLRQLLVLRHKDSDSE